MKKLFCLLLAASMVFSMASCSGKSESLDEPADSTQSTEKNGERNGLDAIGDVDVDSGLFNVTLTVPADFIGEITQEQLDESTKENGYKSATLNNDGSVTYVMTKAQHQDMMEGIRKSIDDSLSEMANSEEYPSIVKIEANSDYTKYTVTLNTEEVGIMEGFASMGLYVFSGTYHIFNGTEPGNINVQYVNEATGKVIDETNSENLG